MAGRVVDGVGVMVGDGVGEIPLGEGAGASGRVCGG